MARLRSIISLFLTIPIILLSAGSCSTEPARNASPWRQEDLRLIDPTGDALSDSTDILAAYLRTTTQDFQIRVDLLDLSIESKYRLDVFIYQDDVTAPICLVIRDDEISQVTDLAHPEKSTLRARVVRDPWLDFITISINRNLLSKNLRVALVTFLPGKVPDGIDYIFSGWPAEAQDTTPAMSLQGTSPEARAPVLIAFTHSFPATTPAQALRRWDGAHTGPNGGRHGLKHILMAADNTRIPIVLADLKIPSSLAALNFLGGIQKTQEMVDDGLLILPQVAFGEPADVSLEFSDQAADAFALPESPFFYSASSDLLSEAKAQFISLPVNTHILKIGSRRLIPLPVDGSIPEATSDGPCLDVRRAMIAAALSTEPGDLVVLGGSLPDSTWGNSEAASATFTWLAAHPWIHVMGGSDLQNFPAAATNLSIPATNTLPPSGNDLLSALRVTPQNSVSESAWLTWFMLTAPQSDANLTQLRENYLGQVGILTMIAGWVDNPYSLADCERDPDLDLMAECILANESYIAVIELNGARLTHLYRGEHQLVGPTAQFALGLSDSSTWNLIPGDGADPGQVMGAFTDEIQPYLPYSITLLEGDALILTSLDGTREKSFRLDQQGLEVEVHSNTPLSFQVPLAVDPQDFYSGPSEFLGILTPDSWEWGPSGGLRARLHTDGTMQAQGFTISIPFVSLPENPNLDYPKGHFFPFPLSIVDIQGKELTSVNINIP